jgi:hypothetical protein
MGAVNHGCGAGTVTAFVALGAAIGPALILSTPGPRGPEFLPCLRIQGNASLRFFSTHFPAHYREGLAAGNGKGAEAIFSRHFPYAFWTVARQGGGYAFAGYAVAARAAVLRPGIGGGTQCGDQRKS